MRWNEAHRRLYDLSCKCDMECNLLCKNEDLDRA